MLRTRAWLMIVAIVCPVQGLAQHEITLEALQAMLNTSPIECANPDGNLCNSIIHYDLTTGTAQLHGQFALPPDRQFRAIATLNFEIGADGICLIAPAQSALSAEILMTPSNAFVLDDDAAPLDEAFHKVISEILLVPLSEQLAGSRTCWRYMPDVIRDGLHMQAYKDGTPWFDAPVRFYTEAEAATLSLIPG